MSPDLFAIAHGGIFPFQEAFLLPGMGAVLVSPTSVTRCLWGHRISVQFTVPYLGGSVRPRQTYSSATLLHVGLLPTGVGFPGLHCL